MARKYKSGSITFREGRPKPYLAQIILPTGKRKSASFKTLEEAELFLEKMANLLKVKLDLDLDDNAYHMTTIDYLKYWLDTRMDMKNEDETDPTSYIARLRGLEEIKYSTYKGYKSTFSCYVYPNLPKDLLLINTQVSHITQLFIKLMPIKKTRTFKAVKDTLNAAFDYAVKAGIITSNPVSGFKVTYTSPKRESLNLDQIQLLLIVSKGSYIKNLIALCLAIGLRMGEALALKWDDIDVVNGIIRVEKQVQRMEVNGKMKVKGNKEDRPDKGTLLLETSPKTISSIHNCYYGENLWSYLQSQKIYCSLRRIASGNFWSENNLIFPSEKGTYLEQKTTRGLYNDALEKARCPHYHVHDMRHTFFSYMGFSLGNILKDIGGHKDLRSTLRYTHITKESFLSHDKMILGNVPADNIDDYLVRI